jgi:hypothetical protein
MAQASLAALQQAAHDKEDRLFMLASADEEARAGQQRELEAAMAELERAQVRKVAAWECTWLHEHGSQPVTTATETSAPCWTAV